MGGWSSEREVSLRSGAACVNSLRQLNMDVTAIDVQRDMGALINSLSPKPDVIFNVLHGRYGEDGCLQGLFDILGIPYTHSGRLASALAMDKPSAKKIFNNDGIPTARHCLVSAESLKIADPMPRPYVLKPCNEGSSVGVYVVRDNDNLEKYSDTGLMHGEVVMAEEYIAGKEFTVAVMGDRALNVTDITTKRDFYDYDAKYNDGGSFHRVPAQIEDDLATQMIDYALRAHKGLGCRGVTRSDFRFDGERLVILELNTQPGMTSTSLVPEQAASVGINFEDLVLWMVENAECDK